MKALAKEKDLLEREKWELRRQAKEATDHASALRSQLDLKDNRMKELEAELAMVSWRAQRARPEGQPCAAALKYLSRYCIAASAAVVGCTRLPLLLRYCDTGRKKKCIAKKELDNTRCREQRNLGI